MVSQDLKAAGVFPNTDPDGHWWIPEGHVFLSPHSNDTAAQELVYARNHFFLPHRYRDPFGQTTTITYDSDPIDPSRNHNLLIVETKDPVGNVVTVKTKDNDGGVEIRNDYRVLQPYWVTDPNGSRTRVAFDALGMVVGTAVMGKPPPEPVEGDSLEGFEADLKEAVVLDHLAKPLTDPHAILQRATTRLVYDLFAYQRTKADPEPQPAVVYTLARETHDADLGSNEQTKVQHSFSYSDGFGREIQKKIQAEPGPLVEGGPVVNPRWVGSGWTIFNNKGKPVRQYEPFFDDTHDFKFGKKVGVSPVLFYDPLERVVATLHPNHTYEKVVFDPWRQTTYDVNDTVARNNEETGDPRTDQDIKGYVTEYFKTQPDGWQTWYQQRITGTKGAQEKSAAEKAEKHADTPTIAYFDTLGRTFLTVADNGLASDGTRQEYKTRLELDIEGNQRTVIDALGRKVMRYDYDMLGNRIHQASMDAGERWMLNDVTGKSIRAWDSRGHQFKTEYDLLRRPLRYFVRGTDASHSDPRTLNRDVLFEKIEYGEGQADDTVLNLRTRVFKQYDGAGVVTNEAYDFKGNLSRSNREVAQDYKNIIDWETTQPPGETYKSSTTYDALNRPIELTASDNSVIHPTYNEANLLDKVDVNLRGEQESGQPKWTPFVTNINYDAKGQRVLIEYGSGAVNRQGVTTTYKYDENTFRLIHLKTTRPGFPANEQFIQDLSYTYDPAGNITHIRDDAQQTIFFRNQRVEPSNDYTYDAIYRLITATGREHLGQAGGAPAPTSPSDTPRIGRDHPNNAQAMGRYEEEYVYDQVGNILSVRHRGADSRPGWKRCYQYALDSNRLLSTGSSSDPHNPDGACPVHYAATPVYAEKYGYDAHGNMISMPHLAQMTWDFKDQLHSADLGGGGTAYYAYDAGGERVRKVVEKNNGNLVEERIYLGRFEIFRQRNGNGVKLERETLHVMDDKQRIALVETKTVTNPNDDSAEQLIRYQFGNHLGSASLELDDQAQVISYEEYYPYGSTSYQAVNKDIKAAAKRYRYTGKERDEESGLYYHGARYYAPWLGRWVSCDPAGMVDGPNIYLYAVSNPTVFVDTSGKWGTAVHEKLFDKAFEKSLPPWVLKELKRGSKDVDATINQFTSGHAPEHSMREGKMRQEEAEKLRDAFIQREVRLAKHAFDRAAILSEQARSDPSDSGKANKAIKAKIFLHKAYFHVGRLLHPVQDSTSPAHSTEGRWDRWPSLGEIVWDALNPLVTIEPDTAKSGRIVPLQKPVHLEEAIEHGFFATSRETLHALTPKLETETLHRMKKVLEDNFAGYEKYFRLEMLPKPYSREKTIEAAPALPVIQPANPEGDTPGLIEQLTPGLNLPMKFGSRWSSE